MLATTDALAEVFSDASVLRTLVNVEAAIARAQAKVGLIPDSAAQAISAAARSQAFDAESLVRDARQSGTIAVPLVSALTAHVRAADESAARFVHWGVTSQDVVDTALVLLIRRGAAALARDHARLSDALHALSDRHAGDVMLGRTVLQPAPPITFGLKVAGWYAAIERCWSRVEHARRDVAVLQFGGASGTLAALGDQGLAVSEALANELGLTSPDGPWHSSRDRLAAFVAACGIYTGALGKMARDISLLMQPEVGEAAEPGGGSSTMPHKQNPVGCAIALAAATRLPGLVSSALSSLTHEHERAAGAWHAEWPIVSDAIQTTGAALAAMSEVASGLIVDPSKMRKNLERTKGAIFAERVMMLAGATLGRDRAHALVREVLAQARGSGESFAAAVRATPELARLLSDDDLRSIDDPKRYLGVAETFRKRLLEH